MPRIDWRITRLGDFVTHQKGFAFKSSDYCSDGHPIVRVSNFTSRSINVADCNYISPASADLYRECALQTGDVVIATVGSWANNPASVVGKTVRVPAEADGAFLNQNAVRLRGERRLDQRFLFYLLKSESFKEYIVGTAQGSANQASITLKDIFGYEFSLPSLSEQRAIAHVLGALDDKIELNRRMNRTLESIAQGFFKAWFVDAAEKELPHGWRKARLFDCCDNIFSGGTPNTQVSEYWGGRVPWLSSGETRSKFIITTEKTVTPKGVANSSTRLASAGATVIASAGQGHTRGQTSYLTFDSYINQSVVALVPDHKVVSNIFLFFDLERRYEELRRLSDSHSSRGSLTTKLLADLTIVVPPRDLILDADQELKPIIELIIGNLHESSTLASVRDTLLPKLLSGQITIKTT
jgi:type I restriction enzyme S subunit